MKYEERESLSSEELGIALAEMQLAGHIKYAEDGENIKLTDAGDEYAWDLWFGLSPKDRLSLFILTDLIRGVAELEEK